MTGKPTARLAPGEAKVLAVTPLLPLLGLIPGVGAWLVPLVAPATLWRPFARAVREDRIRRAWALAMLWALLLVAGVSALTLLAPDLAARAILNGEAYREEMFTWIATGEGPEGDPRQFVPQHLLHLGAFLLLSLVSGGYLGLALGAALLNYMTYFVSAFARASGSPLGWLVAWVPWSVVRILAFVLLGALAARPLLAGWRQAFTRRDADLILLGLAGVVADLVLKAALAPRYGEFLRSLVRASFGL